MIAGAFYFILKNKKNNLFSVKSDKKEDKSSKEIYYDKSFLDLEKVPVKRKKYQTKDLNIVSEKVEMNRYLVSPVRQIFSI